MDGNNDGSFEIVGLVDRLGSEDTVGESVGLKVGASVGLSVGESVGAIVGVKVGLIIGDKMGLRDMLGDVEGFALTLGSDDIDGLELG